MIHPPSPNDEPNEGWVVPPKPMGDVPDTDLGRAEAFIEWLEASVRYISAWKQWAIWTERGWKLDEGDSGIMTKAQAFANSLLDAAGNFENEAVRKQATVAAKKACSADALSNLIKLTRSNPEVAAQPTDFDSDPFMLGCMNGVIDLKTGDFRETRMEDRLLKRCAAEFDPKATCPYWEKVLETILPDRPLREFVHRAIGYSFTGSVKEQVAFFLYGTGSNGKSTFIDILTKLAADYNWRANASLFLAEKGTNAANMMSSLPERRFVVGSEMDENARLAEARIKDLTGGDVVNARKLYCNEFSFRPTHKLWFYGNHHPAVYGSDDGIWRRLKLVPFLTSIPDDEKDLDIIENLWKERSGILNWVIAGCRLWQAEGLKAPEMVREATEQYRDDEDFFGQFLDEECVLGAAHSIRPGNLACAYKEWCESQGFRYVSSPRAVANRLRKMPGVVRRQGSGDDAGKQFWSGIKLSDPAAYNQ